MDGAQSSMLAQAARLGLMLPLSSRACVNRRRPKVRAHKDNAAVWGLEPVNEPWQYTPLETLKKFYWDAYCT